MLPREVPRRIDRMRSARISKRPAVAFVAARGPLARRAYDRLPQNHPLPPVYRLAESAEVALGELVRDTKLARVEAALFAADEPLTARKLATVAELTDAAEARRAVQRLKEFYETDGTAFQIEEIAGGWQLRTRAEFHPWLVRLRRINPDPRLSGAALETLAIIAYRQPIMRAGIEAIRGVQCGELLRHLMERGLVRIAGRDNSLGRPVLYGTSRKFLQIFGLNSLKDLPEIEQLRQPKSS
jgi:segregation and condensation protein B